MNTKRCPIRDCESLILPTRVACHECLMLLPEADRITLSRVTRHARGSVAHLQVEAEAVASINRAHLWGDR